jgi:hypothetical protein
MTPNLQQQPSQASQLLSMSDKYETFRNDMSWGNHRGRKSFKGKMATPSSSKAVARQPFKEIVADPSRFLQAMASATPKGFVSSSIFLEQHNIGVNSTISHQHQHQQHFSTSILEFVEPEKEKFDLMNVKIVIYGLNGLMCEKGPPKRRLFGRKYSGMSVDASGKGSSSMGFSGSSISSGDIFSTNEADCLDTNGVPTTAVVSCQKNAISSQTSLETFLPSMPIQRPVATFVNKVRYSASWPSEQSTLQQDDGAVDRSSFQIIRCMQQTSFVPGVGAGSNYSPETVELRINLSRGTELIRLGTASLVINGDEEGEVSMNIPAKPIPLNTKKLKKKKNKYGYFSEDPTRRYFLDDNATLRIGIQVIPEEAVRFVQEKEKVKREHELNQILQQDDLKELLRQMGNDNLDRTQRLEIKSLTADMFAAAKECNKHQDPLLIMHQDEYENAHPRSSFSDMFCGAVSMPKIPAAFCVASPFMHHQDEPEIPLEIHTEQELDKFAITSIISSVSESTDGSFLGKYHFMKVRKDDSLRL